MTLAEAAERLRGSIEAGAYRRSLVLLEEFRAAVDAARAGGRPAEALTAVKHAMDHLDHVRRLALCQRAHLAAEYDALSRIGPYLGARPRHGGLAVKG